MSIDVAEMKHFGHAIQDDLAKEPERHLASFGGVS